VISIAFSLSEVAGGVAVAPESGKDVGRALGGVDQRDWVDTEREDAEAGQDEDAFGEEPAPSLRRYVTRTCALRRHWVSRVEVRARMTHLPNSSPSVLTP
jgi:hypothetical protein